MNLYVIDASALVHTADSSKYYADRLYYGYPVGGIHFLMRKLCNILIMHDDFVLCFDSPSFRKSIFRGYKHGRQKNYRVISQLDTLYQQLNGCGIKCEKLDGYEADDLIFWATNSLCKQFVDVVILGNDYDLCHNVHENIRFQSIRSDVNNINASNFSLAIKKGETIPFNTISANKVFCGCTSDKIPAFTAECGKSGKVLYVDFITFCEKCGVIGKWDKTSASGLVSLWAKYAGYLTDADKVELEKRCKLVYPADMTAGYTFKPANYKNINLEKFSKVLTLFDVSDAFKSTMFSRVRLSEDDKQYVRGLAKAFNSGQFCGDNNMPFDKPRIYTSVLELDSFSRDF